MPKKLDEKDPKITQTRVMKVEYPPKQTRLGKFLKPKGLFKNSPLSKFKSDSKATHIAPKKSNLDEIKYVFETRNLSVAYNKGKKVALKDVNLKIQHKQITALIGPSGCGKSTLIRCLNRMNDLIPETIITGQIILDEYKDITNPRTNVISLRTRIGMVFQKPNPFPFSIYNNVAYGPRSHGIKNKEALDKIVEKALHDAALWDEVKDRLNDNAISLSGGQQQRLCIARSIAMEPEVLLMDEPTAALDPISTSKIEALIKKLKEKYTIVIVTHSMQQATRISDYTAFFYMGELIEFGETDQIFNKPALQRTNDYVNGRVG